MDRNFEGVSGESPLEGGSKPSDAELRESPEELLLAYQRGEADAASALVRALSPALYRYFLSHTGKPEQADDLLQDTWLRVHRARHTFRAGEPVMPWLFAIAHRAKVDGYRKRRRIESREQAVEVLPESGSAPEPSSRKKSGPGIDTLLNALPDSQRELLIMLKVAGMSLEEAARATGSTVGAVKQKVHRAYEKLRGILERSKGGSEAK